MGLSFVIPTLKCSTKSINEIENYRPISILPVIGKMFEKYNANSIEPYFVFHENQWGILKNGCCGRTLFDCCSLDISKAFDRINRLALPQAMSMKSIPACVVRVFANWWGKLHGMVLWRGKLSDSVLVGSDVP